jgi:uncharacterized membrane protein
MSTTTFPTQALQPRDSASWLNRHWFLVFALSFGLWVWLPLLAPVFMHVGWNTPARAIYFIYSFFCHQLPERSFFLFGSMPMHSLAEIRAAGDSSLNPFILRRFIGDSNLGWKVAWSDRMISLFTSIWLFAVLWRPLRRKIRPLPWWAAALFLLPIVLDGGSHAVSDLAGIGQGFRDSNAWLAVLTKYGMPPSFYAGDALGSFNSWMRLGSGILAGLGLVWFAFPNMETPIGKG